MKAMSPDVHSRYQRASDLLDAVLAARTRSPHRPGPSAGPDAAQVQDIQTRLKARETPQPRFCWQCRKPLHARSDRCPFCGEAQ